MRKILNFESAGYVVIISISCLLSLVGCSANSDLSRSMAEDMILSNSEYPREITKNIMVEYSTGASSLPIETYANELKRLGLANAEINKKKDSFAGLLTHTNIKVTLTDKGKEYVRGKKESGWLHVLSYLGSFGEVTGIIFTNEGKTSAVVEYTESYEPTPFATVDIPYRGSHKELQTVNKKAYFQMYDDGWRVVKLDK